MRTSIIREDVVQELVATGKWSKDSARLGERAGYRCEYCGFDLLASADAYKLWEVDHIVPVSKGGSYTGFDNMALACRQCNWCWKGDWDPRPDAGDNPARAQLIAAASAYIACLKAESLAELVNIRRIVRWKHAEQRELAAPSSNSEASLAALSAEDDGRSIV